MRSLVDDPCANLRRLLREGKSGTQPDERRDSDNPNEQFPSSSHIPENNRDAGGLDWALPIGQGAPAPKRVDLVGQMKKRAKPSCLAIAPEQVTRLMLGAHLAPLVQLHALARQYAAFGCFELQSSETTNRRAEPERDWWGSWLSLLIAHSINSSGLVTCLLDIVFSPVFDFLFDDFHYLTSRLPLYTGPECHEDWVIFGRFQNLVPSVLHPQTPSHTLPVYLCLG